MADPKKVRAEANALVQELLARLDASDVRELEVTRGAIRVRVAKDAPPQKFVKARHFEMTAVAQVPEPLRRTAKTAAVFRE